ncbi:MAG: GNAT family N-acetyltransferase [Thermoleophilia bacterium]
MHLPVIAKVDDSSAISVVAALAHETWNRHFVPIVGQAQVDHMLEKFQSASAIAAQIASGYLYFTIAVDNQKVGYFALAPVLPGSSEAQLSKIYVMAGQKGRGLGKCMLAFAEDLCAGMGARKL